MDKGDLGTLVGGILSGGLTAKLLGDAILTTTFGPAYLIGSTIIGAYLGHHMTEPHS